MDENYVMCGSPGTVLSLEPDDGSEVLSCAACLGGVAARLLATRRASGEMKLYDVRGA